MDNELPAHVKYWLDYSKNDCFFNVGPSSGPNKRIGAIKILLMGHSEPLRKMLEESDMAEKGDIYLPDIEPNSFKVFLKCVYGGSDVVIKHLTFEECAKLFYIAEKYLVAQIKQDVLAKMMKQVPFSINEVLVALKHIVCFQDKSLNIAITNILTQNTKELFADKMFLDISSESLLMIVQQQSLNVQEIDVFKAVVKWAENKLDSQDGSVIRAYISGLIQFIRFRVMSIQEFCLYVIPTKILTTEEACSMCTSIVSNKPHELKSFGNNTNLRFNQTLKKKMRIGYSCSIESISGIESYFSELTEIEDYFWLLSFTKFDDYLSLYLVCEPQSDTEPWELNVTVDLILMNQCGNADLERSFSCKYNQIRNRWGYSKFKRWADVVDPSQGYIRHGIITVVAYITLS